MMISKLPLASRGPGPLSLLFTLFIPGLATAADLPCDPGTEECYGEPEPVILGDPRTIGFWKHQFAVATGESRGRAQVKATTLESWLPITVFNVTIDSLDEANDVLWLGRASMQARAVQQCFATLLNYEYGEVGLATPIGLDGEEVLFIDLLDEAEAAYSDGDYERAKDLCDGFNNL